jgi:hypothetical protein
MLLLFVLPQDCYKFLQDKEWGKRCQRDRSSRLDSQSW